MPDKDQIIRTIKMIWNDRLARKLILAILVPLFLFVLLDIIFPLNAHIDYSQTILSSDGEILGAYLSQDGQWRFKAGLDEMSPKLIKTVIYKEDRWFYYHSGINPFSLFRAFASNIISGKRTYGASTITMQLARMLEPKDRNYFNKFIELFRAIQLEAHYSKDEILEMYFNHLPYGGNIEGCKAGSVLFLETNPDKLSLAQAVALSVIPQNPNKYIPGRFNAEIEKKKNRILGLIKNSGLFPDDEIKAAFLEKITAYRREIPKYAPQLCFRLSRKYRGESIVRSTIDFRIQSAVADLVRNHMVNQKEKNIHNAAVIIVDNRTKNVIAYVGSNDFDDKFHNGQVDGVTSVRSPGSALKPLAYAIGFDMGLITPKMKILDVPILNSTYSPENFSGTFKGEVTAEQALIKSLNVPAVRLIQQEGYEKFVNKLIRSGFKTINEQKSKLGLSVVLGGCGVTLEEIARLYSGFATDGFVKDLNYVLAPSLKLSITHKPGFKITGRTPSPALPQGRREFFPSPLERGQGVRLNLYSEKQAYFPNFDISNILHPKLMDNGKSIRSGPGGVSYWSSFNKYTEDPSSFALYVSNSPGYDTSNYQVISPEAAFMIADILSKSPRQDVIVDYMSLQDIPLFAWKTGTSYGRRDAWSIGFNPEYTVGVWAGNFSGEPSSELTGSTVSTPLLFDIFRFINRNNKTWFRKPENLMTRLVDEETGLLPGDFTVNTVEDYYIPMVSSNEVSASYENVFVSPDEKMSYCQECLPPGNYRIVAYPKIQPDLMSYYEQFSLPYKKIPPHNPACPRISHGTPPVIVQPYNGQEYLLEKQKSQKIMLQCSAENDVHEVCWYINNIFFAKAKRNEKLFFTPDKPGPVKISCNDEFGRNCDVKIKVTFF